MTPRESPLHWSFSIGTWFLTRVRVSVFFPLLIVLFCFRWEPQIGVLVGAILFFSVLAHEFGHIAAARLTGGGGDEILIWPLGGLAYVQTAPTLQSKLITAAAGPFVNLAICGITLAAVLQSEHTADALRPLILPAVALTDQILLDVLVVTFTVNWVLLLVNLIPVYPLDGGRMLQAVLTASWGGENGTRTYLRIGFICALIMMFGGLLIDSVWLVFIGAVVLVLNMQESVQIRTSDAYEDSFMGYDFSQGYTSLERSSDKESEPRKPGFLQRWRERRRAEKQRREEQRRIEAEQELDVLLDKVHSLGIESLTEAEKRRLHQASARFRNKEKKDGVED